MKNVEKTCDSLLARRTKAINVDIPPLRTAGPMFTSVASDLERRSPEIVRKVWLIWAE